MVNSNNDLVSIIIRTVGGDRFAIEKAIFSVYCNSYDNKEIVIIYQGIDTDFLEFLNNLAKIYDGIKFNIINNPTANEDQRSKNLNIGIKSAKGRYIGFLDDDDQISQEHIETLVNAINAQGVIWAYSDCCVNIVDGEYLERKQYTFVHELFSCNNLMVGNYIPLHSFLIDVKKISDRNILIIDENLTRLEDYYLLLNLASIYRPFYCKTVTCFYNIRSDGSNSNSGLIKKDLYREAEWENSHLIIRNLKTKLKTNQFGFTSYYFGQDNLSKSPFKYSKKLYVLTKRFFLRKAKLIFQIFCTISLTKRHRIVLWIQLIKKL